ncbi:MAG: ATP-binding cassette domain-containing protein [Burkholderiales bacterium]|nr:ATP-binding cassette domain-containing protein [Burkholderiales bacterium]
MDAQQRLRAARIHAARNRPRHGRPRVGGATAGAPEGDAHRRRRTTAADAGAARHRGGQRRHGDRALSASATPATPALPPAVARPPTAPSAVAPLRANGLVKRYGARLALDHVGLELRAGEWTALLGPNGAGKSTLFALLTGLFAADEGAIEIGGHDLAHAPARALREIGVVYQQQALDLDLSVERNLRFHAALHGLPGAWAAARIDAALAAHGLATERRRAVRELSGGNRRKVELARALLHAPRVLLMDEPTVGLDPRSRHDLLQAIAADVRERGSAVLWATHLVEEAAQADRVLVLHQGRLLADGAPAAVAGALGGGSLEQAFLRATAARPTKDPSQKEAA